MHISSRHQSSSQLVPCRVVGALAACSSVAQEKTDTLQPYPNSLTRRRGVLMNGGRALGAPAACSSVALDTMCNPTPTP